MIKTEMLELNAHERGLLDFVADRQRDRLGRLFEMGPRRRMQIVEMLNHDIRLKPETARHLSGSAELADAVIDALRSRGAPDQCHVISTDRRLDGRDMPLADAIVTVCNGQSGTFVSCLPGKLAYFRYASAMSSYLLHKCQDRKFASSYARWEAR